MAAVPDDGVDPTLALVDEAYSKKQNEEQVRPYLGMSGAGEDCLRKLFYSFRWALPNVFDATTHKRFEDGHRTEDLIGNRLKLAKELTVNLVDPETGKQFEFVDIGGHFLGHTDGDILGILQAPKTRHLLEIKCCNDDKLAKLVKLKAEVGEKNALKAWDAIYYVQHTLYMYYAGLTRGYLICTSPGGRTWVSCRTNADTDEAVRQIKKAEIVIESEDLPPQGYPSETFYKCRWCEYSGLCWGKDIPQRNCRTCIFAAPVMEGGKWMCHQFKETIPDQEQRKTHPCHRYNPTFIPLEQTDFDDVTTDVTYNGWLDQGP